MQKGLGSILFNFKERINKQHNQIDNFFIYFIVQNISSRQLQISIYNKLFLVAFSLDSLQMNLKTCLQFDETDSSETEAFNHLEVRNMIISSSPLIYSFV